MTMIIEHENQINEEFLTAVLRKLRDHGSVIFSAQPVMDRAKEPKRFVVAAATLSTDIVIALEGSGCLILGRNDRVNEFRFIEAGFQIGAAHIAVALFRGLAGVSRAAAPDTSRDVRQLEDKRS